MRKPSKEFNFLLSICKIAIFDTKPKEQSSSHLPKDINWEELYQLAAYHRVRPIFYEGLQKCNLVAVVPPSFFKKLKRLSLSFLFQNLSNAKELSRLLKLFKKQGIEVIPYKGIILGQEAYQNIGIRESSDIDLLIQQEDFDKISDLLLSENYQYELDVSPLFKKLSFKLYNEINFDFYEGGKRKYHVEPHWSLGSEMNQIFIDFNAIESFTNKKFFLDAEINQLTPEGLIITTIVHHGGTDSWSYLKLIIDLASIVEHFEVDLDWELVIKKCQQLKILNLLLLGLGLAQDFFSISLPLIITKKIKQNGLIKLVKYQKIKISSKTERPKPLDNFIGRIYYSILLRKSWATKIRVVYYHFLHIFIKLFAVSKYTNPPSTTKLG